MGEKYLYFFGDGKAEGRADMRAYLGGKGANLAEMSNLGLPVPPGFTISTNVCKAYYEKNRKYPAGLSTQLKENLFRLEETMQAGLGDTTNPLLVSVRSGAAASMPGMMDTVLNLGLNQNTLQALINKTGNERFAWDAYRRLISMFGDVVMGLDRDRFEHEVENIKKKAHIKNDTELTVKHLQALVKRFKEIYKKATGENFVDDPKVQLQKAIDAVFDSWNNPRAIKYRKLYNIQGLLGTAVNVQAMVFGNMGDHSATGVCFTRNPSTGENILYGEFLFNAQGEDVVAGIRTPEPIINLRKEMPRIYKQILQYKNLLEKRYRDMQDMEFTIQEGKLYMLQTRNGKRTAKAALKIAADMVKEGFIDKKAAVLRIEPQQLDQLLHPVFDPKANRVVITTGLPASPGAATGKVVFSSEEAEKLAARNEKVILVRKETSPEDVAGMHAAQGILTSRGGMTSHAAVVARGMGRCCVVGAGDVNVDYNLQQFTVNSKVIRRGDHISLDGTVGEVMQGRVPTIEPKLTADFSKLMKWADEFRKLDIRTNADTPEDATKARTFGAQGIGLCRTEHMFFGEHRINYVRQMIMLAPEVKNLKARIGPIEQELQKAPKEEKAKLKAEIAELKKALKRPNALFTQALRKLLPMQRGDFEKMFRAMKGLPVTIRLLDPPLHEFLPHGEDHYKEMARKFGMTLGEVIKTVTRLQEVNPMLGHRGCRLGITYTDIYDMQVTAIIEAACNVKKKGLTVYPEIMVPLVGMAAEFNLLKDNINKQARAVMKKKGVKVKFAVGTMIELPRAALMADKLAEQAEFFSFGTNDLTQMTFGLSRDDVANFLPDYIEQGILKKDPFQSLDQDGVGQLIEIGVKKGRSTRPNLKIGICGEHGGDPDSIEFCHRIGMNYVSCSPYRVPIARLTAARANIHGAETSSTV
ncbi:MAG: pyruvate, phosphate dikinase [Candidatus Brocadiales bacterium]|nr:pyruvate, phosphate dikinase [Candidatus Bathyanammoxibius amoris]